jgi:hypothetical protein
MAVVAALSGLPIGSRAVLGQKVKRHVFPHVACVTGLTKVCADTTAATADKVRTTAKTLVVMLMVGDVVFRVTTVSSSRGDVCEIESLETAMTSIGFKVVRIAKGFALSAG